MMSIKKSVFIAASLDGYIARTDGSIDWLINADNNPEVDFGYSEFIKNIDVIIMGRKSFEMILTFDNWAYGNIKLIVLTSGKIILPENFNHNVEITSKSPKELITRLESDGFKHAYIDGGKTIQNFLSEGLINEITITTIPILIGNGIPLFGFLPADVKLELLKTLSYENGFIQSAYKIIEQPK